MAECPKIWEVSSNMVGVISLVEITAFRLERIFQPMRALEFITGHLVYNLAYN